MTFRLRIIFKKSTMY